MRQDVVLRDTTGHARAFELSDVDPVFFGNLADQGTRFRLPQFFSGCRRAVASGRGDRGLRFLSVIAPVQGRLRLTRQQIRSTGAAH